MKHRVNDLTGALLDAAVAMAEAPGLDQAHRVIASGEWWLYRPSTLWDDGGPIIEREWIEVQRHAGGDGWWAGIRQPTSVNKAGAIDDALRDAMVYGSGWFELTHDGICRRITPGFHVAT